MLAKIASTLPGALGPEPGLDPGDSGHWFRSYGNENWEFDEKGLMRVRIASINDAPIKESERKYHWPLGRRPDERPSLSDLGL